MVAVQLEDNPITLYFMLLFQHIEISLFSGYYHSFATL